MFKTKTMTKNMCMKIFLEKHAIKYLTLQFCIFHQIIVQNFSCLTYAFIYMPDHKNQIKNNALIKTFKNSTGVEF